MRKKATLQNHAVNVETYFNKNDNWFVRSKFPGNYTHWSGGQEENRGSEVHFYKFMGDGKSTQPSQKNGSLYLKQRSFGVYLKR